MRLSTVLFLAAAVLLVMAYGWKALGVAALVLAGFVLLPILAIVALVVWLRWRVRRQMRQFAEALAQAQAAQAKSGVIDMDAKEVRNRP